MKKPLFICAAVMAFAVPAHAQLFMAWNACDGTAGSSTANKNFDCTAGSGFAAELWATFGLPGSTADVVAIDGIIDFDQRPDGRPRSGTTSPAAATTRASAVRPRNQLHSVRHDELRAVLWLDGSGCAGGITAYVNGSEFRRPEPCLAVLKCAPGDLPVTLPGADPRVLLPPHLHDRQHARFGWWCAG
jgi:hypothetical protein